MNGAMAATYNLRGSTTGARSYENCIYQVIDSLHGAKEPTYPLSIFSLPMDAKKEFERLCVTYPSLTFVLICAEWPGEPYYACRGGDNVYGGEI